MNDLASMVKIHKYMYIRFERTLQMCSGGGGVRIGAHFTLPGLKDVVRAARIPRFLLRKFASNNSSFLPAGITKNEL